MIALRGQTQLQFHYPVPAEKHPCYWKLGRRLAHRAYLPREGQLIFCERCGAELDRRKNQVCEEIRYNVKSGNIHEVPRTGI